MNSRGSNSTAVCVSASTRKNSPTSCGPRRLPANGMISGPGISQSMSWLRVLRTPATSARWKAEYACWTSLTFCCSLIMPPVPDDAFQFRSMISPNFKLSVHGAKAMLTAHSQPLYNPRMSSFAIGVDLGGTNLRIAAIDETGTLLEKITMRARPKDGPEAVIDRMCSGMLQLIARYSSHLKFLGAGVGIPGIIEMRSGMLRESPNLPGWHDYKVR